MNAIDRVHPNYSNLHLAYMQCLKIFDGEKINSRSILSKNIIQNHDFSQGLQSWHPNSCKCFIAPSSEQGNAEALLTKPDGGYAIIKDKTEWWAHLLQDITTRVSPGVIYSVSAIVAASGNFNGCSEIQASLKFEHHNNTCSYRSISRIHVAKDEWELLKGSFVLKSLPRRLFFYLEGVPGPFAGLELLIKSVHICPLSPSISQTVENVIVNHQFDDGLKNWSGRGCNIKLLESIPKILSTNKVFASTANRTLSWNGIQQEITGRVQSKLSYEAIAVARIYGNNCSSANVTATLWIQSQDNPVERISIASVQATDNEWRKLEGKFIIKESSPTKVVIYLEGPPPGTDILLKSLVVKLAEK